MRACLCVGMLAWACAAVPGLAQTGQPPEAMAKAAQLVSFPKFVEWPAGAFRDNVSPFVIGVMGRDCFGPVVQAVARNRCIAGRPVEVRYVSSADGLTECQVVFVARSEEARQREVLNGLDGRPVLTVGDSPHFLRDGGMIQFRSEPEGLRFAVSREATQRARLRVSAELLEMGLADPAMRPQRE